MSKKCFANERNNPQTVHVIENEAGKPGENNTVDASNL